MLNLWTLHWMATHCRMKRSFALKNEFHSLRPLFKNEIKHSSRRQSNPNSLPNLKIALSKHFCLPLILSMSPFDVLSVDRIRTEEFRWNSIYRNQQLQSCQLQQSNFASKKCPALWRLQLSIFAISHFNVWKANVKIVSLFSNVPLSSHQNFRPFKGISDMTPHSKHFISTLRKLSFSFNQLVWRWLKLTEPPKWVLYLEM